MSASKNVIIGVKYVCNPNKRNSLPPPHELTLIRMALNLQFKSCSPLNRYNIKSPYIQYHYAQ
jgi:hypothetical protein